MNAGATKENIRATILGHPRIGPRRELKRAVEKFWKNQLSSEELIRVADALIISQQEKQKNAGFDSVPVNDFSFYDQVLDTAVLLGALPQRVQNILDPQEQYFVAARGNKDIEPLEMTKWFNTNYHYLVPELSASTQFSLHPEKILHEIDLARTTGVNPRPVIIGPITFLLLSKSIDESPIFNHLDALIRIYSQLLELLADKGISWVQFDEPALIADRSPQEIVAATKVYEVFAALPERPAILLATYFGAPTQSLAPIIGAVDAISIDLVSAGADSAGTDFVSTAEQISPELIRNKHVLVGVVNGRNIWRTDLTKALRAVNIIAEKSASVGIVSSSSLLHVPYSLVYEDKIDPSIAPWLAFTDEKIAEIAALSQAVSNNYAAVQEQFDQASQALANRAADPRLNNPSVRTYADHVKYSDYIRIPFEQRIKFQTKHLGLPVLPTTTIGSFPQTVALRIARQQLGRGEISEEQYTATMRSYVNDCIALQEKIGLDVLVHGEPERNDMVQYFSEQLEGFCSTQNGWVQSYGSRCVRPPILYGDVARPKAMTVEWAVYAQSLTNKPLKGMLTGPVTIIAWSFVRDDQPLSETSRQLALAMRQETIDLERAGIKIIQVDEPALRELLPLRSEDKPFYLEWAVGAFKLATSGVRSETQIHTHLCYSEFGEVIGSILDLDADVTSIEAARSKMEVLDDLKSVGFSNDVGPGVYDIHSPRVPSEAEIGERIRLALTALPVERLWVNPDCGLKTRAYEDVVAALSNMVTAVGKVREDVKVNS